MTIAQFEERLLALERTVEQIQMQLKFSPQPAPAAETKETIPGEEDLIPDAEYPIVLAVPPKEVLHLKGKLRWIRPGPRGLAISDAEWASLQLEEEDV